jgi:hypothetical protein
LSHADSLVVNYKAFKTLRQKDSAFVVEELHLEGFSLRWSDFEICCPIRFLELKRMKLYGAERITDRAINM